MVLFYRSSNKNNIFLEVKHPSCDTASGDTVSVDTASGDTASGAGCFRWHVIIAPVAGVSEEHISWLMGLWSRAGNLETAAGGLSPS